MPTASASRTSRARAGFSFLSTSVPGQTSFPASGGSSFASFLLGDAYTGAHRNDPRTSPRSIRYFGFYAQDDWRITRKLIIESRPALRLHPAADQREGRILRLQPDAAESRRRRLSGSPLVCRLRRGPREHAQPGAGLVRRHRPAHRPGLLAGQQDHLPHRLSAAPSRASPPYRAAATTPASSASISSTNASQGVQPTFKLDEGLPPYKLPPAIDPAFSNGQHRRLVAGPGCHARAGEPVLDVHHPARSGRQHGGRSRLTTPQSARTCNRAS